MIDSGALSEVPSFLEDSLLFGDDIMECSWIKEVEYLPLDRGQLIDISFVTMYKLDAYQEWSVYLDHRSIVLGQLLVES